MHSNLKQRLKWITLYKQLNNKASVCQHFGISRFTLNKWLKRYEESGEDGLADKSSKPHNSPLQKRNELNESVVVKLRRERKLGARRLQSELKRLYDLSFSLSTIHKILKKYQVQKTINIFLFTNTVIQAACCTPCIHA